MHCAISHFAQCLLRLRNTEYYSVCTCTYDTAQLCWSQLCAPLLCAPYAVHKQQTTPRTLQGHTQHSPVSVAWRRHVWTLETAEDAHYGAQSQLERDSCGAGVPVCHLPWLVLRTCAYYRLGIIPTGKCVPPLQCARHITEYSTRTQAGATHSRLHVPGSAGHSVL